MSQRISYHQVAPEAVQALRGVSAYIKSCSIEAPLRFLVELRISQINGCVYCVTMHSREAREAGVSQSKLDCLPVWREAPYYEPRERAALAWAESVTLISQTGVPDEAYEEARRHFSEKELVDLTVIVGMMNLWNRMAVSFRLPPSAQT
ncbi:MAG: carboxymuconolactone decarboxylase family protein [bacterium]